MNTDIDGLQSYWLEVTIATFFLFQSPKGGKKQPKNPTPLSPKCPEPFFFFPPTPEK